MSESIEYSATLAVIDDEDVIRENIQKKLLRLGYEVLPFDNAEDVLEIMTNDLNRIDMVITDIKLSNMDGIELLRRIKLLDKPVPVLIITGHDNIGEAILALRLGASDFIRKPFDINDLASSVKTTLKIIQ